MGIASDLLIVAFIIGLAPTLIVGGIAAVVAYNGK